MEKEKMIYAKNREEWRDWLSKNHDKESKIALLKYKKHTGKPSLSHKESMEEAICFGWIDTTIKKLDEERYIRRFSRRGKKSRWSNNTLSYAKELIKQKKMTPIGLQFYQEGLKRPVIDVDLPRNPEPQKDLLAELKKSKKALAEFESLPLSYKRMYIYWIERAKLPETRKKRIGEFVLRMEQGKRKWTD